MFIYFKTVNSTNKTRQLQHKEIKIDVVWKKASIWEGTVWSQPSLSHLPSLDATVTK